VSTPATDCDVAIIGAGPAGLTAGIYAARAGLAALIFESAAPGGQAATTDLVENFPGFPEPVSGFELAEAMRRQAERWGCGFRSAAVAAVEAVPGTAAWKLRTDAGDIAALAVVAASGARARRLGVPGEDKFWGRGVSTCAICDAALYRGKHVVVVGGGDTAVQEAAFLARFAGRITMVHRRERRRAFRATEDRLAAAAGGKVTELLETRVVEILGGDRVTGVRLEAVKGGRQSELPCDGVFVLVGFVPSSDYLPADVLRDEQGYVLADEDMATSVPGIYACGDVRKKSLRQIVVSCGEGAVAAHSEQNYIEKLKGTAYE